MNRSSPADAALPPPVRATGAPLQQGGWGGAVAVQLLGAGATFGVGLLIALVQGPLAQGRYGIVRALADLLVTLALFGLPQGLVHLINRIGASPAVLARWGRFYLAGAGLVMAGVAALASQGWAPAPGSVLNAPHGYAWLLLGVVGWTAHGLQRGFVLCLGSMQRFAWLTVVPALSMLVAVGVVVMLGSQRFDLAVAASGVFSALAGMLALLPLRHSPRWTAGAPPKARPLLMAGLQSFAQTLALALQTWLTLQVLAWYGVDVAQVGLFVFAAYIWQAFALPAGFVSPLLFAEVSAAGATVALRRRIGRILRWTAGAALVVAVASPWLVPALFGASYAAAVGACVWLAVGGPLLVLNRLGVAVLLGRGGFAAALVLAAVRMAALPLLLWLCLTAFQGHASTLAALSWVGVEAVCALVLLRIIGTASGSWWKQETE